MAITVPDHVLTVSREEVAEIFIAFARFEFALKASGFGKKGPRGEAKIDWDKFASKIATDFNASTTDEVGRAADYLMTAPPQQQHYVNNVLSWKVRVLKPDVSYMDKLLFHVRGVRNNLFHGAKCLQRESEDPCRDAKLVSAASIILGQCLRVAPEVHEAFYAEP